MPSPLDVARAHEDRELARSGVRLTGHARERMAEMGVTWIQVLAIVSMPSVDRPSRGSGGRESARLCHSDAWPDWAVVYDPEPGCKAVMTVVFRRYDEYRREGAAAGPV